MTVDQFQAELRAQGTSSREHCAVTCPVCGTVQSIALLTHEGCPADEAETQIGFSCVGRWNNAGPALKGKNPGGDRTGCDYTLGGLFKLHDLEVEKDGVTHPMFDIATPDEAKALEAALNEHR